MFQVDILSMKFPRMRWIALAVLLSHATFNSVRAEFALFGSGSNQFTMEFVPMGNPNNVDDTTGLPNPAGKVEYTYRMGKFEVSESMITKFNASQSILVTNSARGPNKPTSSISWNSAARFVNWLNTSQGYQAAYNFTTSGSHDPISLWNATDAWQLGGQNLYRHKDARYWLPSMTMAGGLSPFGIMGMGGNVWEFEESDYDLVNDNPTFSRAYRGEAFNNASGGLVDFPEPCVSKRRERGNRLSRRES